MGLENGPEQQVQGRERQRSLRLPPDRRKHAQASALRPIGCRTKERGLADADVSENHHYPAARRRNQVNEAGKLGKFPVATDEAACAATHSCSLPRTTKVKIKDQRLKS